MVCCGVVDGLAEDGAARVWRAIEAGGGELAGGDAGLERDGLPHGAGDADEEEARVDGAARPGLS